LESIREGRAEWESETLDPWLERLERVKDELDDEEVQERLDA